MKFSTKAIHCGDEPNLKEGGSGDVVTPIHMATTFARSQVDVPTAGYEYSRSSNPTRCALEKKLASLEDAQFGLAFASGLAAISTVILSTLKAGDHVVAFDDLYGGTRRLLSKVFEERGLMEVTYVDARDAHNVEKACQSNTRMIWLETPTNPLLKLCDISAISQIAKAHHTLLVVDNTFMSPFFQSPLKLGADIVLHSTTKYMNGHCDSVGGAVMLNDAQLFEQIQYHQNAIGAILSPFDSFLVARGLKTLAVRMQRHQDNALMLANALEKHPAITQVIYPGLKSHPQYPLACQQMHGFGGMISFELNCDLDGTKDFVSKLKLFSLAESLGGVESLVEIPALMTHASIPASVRKEIGLSDSLVRVSIGIEDSEDLLADLTQALPA